MADSQDGRIGQQIGDYRLQRRLGKGTFGTVYLVEHLHDHSQAALKLLQLQLTSGNDLRDFLTRPVPFACAIRILSLFSILDSAMMICRISSWNMLQEVLYMIVTQGDRKSPGKPLTFTSNNLLRLCSMPTIIALFIAMSSQRTCCCARTAPCCSATLGLPRSSSRRV
jgi:serine/threonine protein kinase